MGKRRSPPTASAPRPRRWLNESGQWNADAIERQLAHVDADTVRRAYARGEHWDERVRMMQWWADKLEGWKGER